jgi:hypothetical protein
MKTTGNAKGKHPTREMSAGIPVVYRQKNLKLLHIDHFMQEISRFLSDATTATVKIGAVQKAVYLLVDEREMAKAFAGITRYIGEIAAYAATVTISGGLLPIAGELSQAKGCALVSISIDRYRSQFGALTRKRRAAMRRALAGVKRIVEMHNGVMRTWRQWEEARFNIYLPVLCRVPA